MDALKGFGQFIQNALKYDDGATTENNSIEISTSVEDAKADEGSEDEEDIYWEYTQRQSKLDDKKFLNLKSEVDFILGKTCDISPDDYQKLNNLYNFMLKKSDGNNVDFEELVKRFTPKNRALVKTVKLELDFTVDIKSPTDSLKINLFNEVNRMQQLLDGDVWPMYFCITSVKSNYGKSISITSSLDPKRKVVFGLPTRTFTMTDANRILQDKKKNTPSSKTVPTDSNSISESMLTNLSIEDIASGEFLFRSPYDSALFGHTTADDEVNERNSIMAIYSTPYISQILETPALHKRTKDLVFIPNEIATTIFLYTVYLSKRDDRKLQEIASSMLDTTDCCYYHTKASHLVSLKDYALSLLKRYRISSILLEIQDYMGDDFRPDTLNFKLGIEFVYRI